MENNDQKIDEVLEIVTFIKDNAVTRQELQGELGELRGELEEKFETFGKKIDQRIAGMETRLVTKSYLDDRLADFASELGDRIYRSDEKEKIFKNELVSFLKVQEVLLPEQLKRLEELV